MSELWERQPESEALLYNYLAIFYENHPQLQSWADRLEEQTSAPLFYWIDHFAIVADPDREKELKAAGFEVLEKDPHYTLYHQPKAQLPKVALYEKGNPALGIFVKVEDIAHCLAVHHKPSDIEGSPYSTYRRAPLLNNGPYSLWVVERRAGYSLIPAYSEAKDIENYLKARELWLTRDRSSLDPDGSQDSSMKKAVALSKEIAQLLGKDLGAWVVLEAERLYWQSRNRAGQIQKNRQDRFGMGWANHDHHTFRSSRRYFQQLVECFENLGFNCRERFYAGKEAGWGAQVVENPRCSLVCFLDVDLSEEELMGDFSHERFKTLDHVGTIGLWCRLHGESMLNAGMHHLEAQFHFSKLTEDLAKVGIGMMKPFSNFDYLKQAFTEGEIWPVEKARLDTLLEDELIDAEQYQNFLEKGGLGSHLENLERKDGFKGFNQKNVSDIIARTDPRKAMVK